MEHTRKLCAAIVAAVTILGFSAFKLAEDKTQSMVTLYFQGDTNDAAQVADASNWQESSTSPTCFGEEKACSISVHPNDAFGSPGSRQLNPNQIVLNAVSTGTDYVPTKNNSASNSLEPITVQNRN